MYKKYGIDPLSSLRINRKTLSDIKKLLKQKDPVIYEKDFKSAL